MITFLEVACNATHVAWAGTMSTSGHGSTTPFIVAGKQSQKSQPKLSNSPKELTKKENVVSSCKWRCCLVLQCTFVNLKQSKINVLRNNAQRTLLPSARKAANLASAFAEVLKDNIEEQLHFTTGFVFPLPPHCCLT